MAVLHATRRGAGTPDQVWKVLRDIEAFPDFM